LWHFTSTQHFTLRSKLVLSFYSSSAFQVAKFQRHYSTKILYLVLIPPIFIGWPLHLNLHQITNISMTILSDVYELTSRLSDTNIFHCTLQNYESESSAISALNLPAWPKLKITFQGFWTHSSAKLDIVFKNVLLYLYKIISRVLHKWESTTIQNYSVYTGREVLCNDSKIWICISHHYINIYVFKFTLSWCYEPR
jgi:hypothetical protein